MPKIRKIKVTYKNRVRDTGYLSTVCTQVPQLNVAGEWLRTAGFDIGDQVIIEVSEGELHIKKDPGK